MEMKDVPITKRKWYITIELSNGQVSYNSMVLTDLTKFIKLERLKLQKETGRLRKLVPVTSWIVDSVLHDFKWNLLPLYRVEKPEIVSIKIVPGIKKREGDE